MRFNEKEIKFDNEYRVKSDVNGSLWITFEYTSIRLSNTHGLGKIEIFELDKEDEPPLMEYILQDD